VRTGVYPRVFEPDAQHGLLANETTLADYLRQEGYATKIVGKWHLGSRPGYLPIDRGFDEWFGIPYHMSGGSLDGHVCGKQRDPNGTLWLPLFDGRDIVEQPVDLRSLAPRYVHEAREFIHEHAASQPFFLYMAFSHVHQLCAPRFAECQWASSHFSRREGGFTADFGDAVEEMDWILGGVIDALDEAGVSDDTLVIFTSDNGPWTAEQSCAGSKGPFKGTWLKENVDDDCTACPSEYKPSPLPGKKRRCIYPGTNYEVMGVPCGEDSGLGSAWEANIRMPAIVRWKGHVPVGETSSEMVSTLDVLPTVLSIIGKKIPNGSKVDGIDVKDIFLGQIPSSFSEDERSERAIFFWRDGFKTGPLPAPFGRFDVVAMKIGWYNADEEVYHDPPLILDVLNDPAEAYPLDPDEHVDMISRALHLMSEHKASIEWTTPLTLTRDPKYLPCANAESGCRTSPPLDQGASIDQAEER
jgi:arylsulfatase A-like enzyme